MLFAAWAGCRTEPLTWRKPLNGVILFQDSLGFRELVPDTLWTEGEAGLRLRVRTRQPLFDAPALIPSLDTMWTDVFGLPFVGGPFPIAPGVDIWSEEETVTLALSDAGLRRVRLSGGELTLRVVSTVQGPLELRYSLVGARFPEGVNGGSNEIVLTVDADTAEVVLDLSEVELDLDGLDGLNLNTLNTNWTVAVPASSTDSIGVMGGDEVSLSVALDGLRLAQVEGRFDAQTILLDDSVSLGRLGALESLDVGWTGMEVDLTLVNTTGADFEVMLESLTRTDSVGQGMEATSLEDPVLGQSVFLPRAQLVGGDMNNWTVQPNVAQLAMGQEQSSLADFLSSVPASLGWSIVLGVNPLGDVSGGHDRIDFEQLPELDATVSAPLAVSTARAVLIDTLDVAWPDGLDVQGRLELSVTNSLPVGAELRMSLVDLPSNASSLALAFGPEWWRFDEVELSAGSGNPASPSISQSGLDLMQPHFEALRDGARLRVAVELYAPETGAQFEVDQAIVLEGHLTGDAILSVP